MVLRQGPHIWTFLTRQMASFEVQGLKLSFLSRIFACKF